MGCCNKKKRAFSHIQSFIGNLRRRLRKMCPEVCSGSVRRCTEVFGALVAPAITSVLKPSYGPLPWV